mmetsp:Transcript_136145/g.423030  ORF Transcript_136145/g.423030 Transcript_136145/m.423030 type:complete len:241 (-) Transcript_136145:1-723(-)
MRSAWPLCTGFRSWKTKTASAPISWNFAFNSVGVSLYWSMPSLYLICCSTCNFPPTRKSPESMISLMYGCSGCVMPKVRPARSSFLCSYTCGAVMIATTVPSSFVRAMRSLPSILAFSSAVHAFVIGTGMGTNSPPERMCSKWRLWRSWSSVMKPSRGAAQPSDKTCTHWSSSSDNGSFSRPAADAARPGRSASGTRRSSAATPSGVSKTRRRQMAAGAIPGGRKGVLRSTGRASRQKWP